MWSKVINLISILTIQSFIIMCLGTLAQAQPMPGDALVTDISVGTNQRGVLFSVDLSTGNRTLVSDFGNPAQSPLGIQPYGVTLDSSGDAVVIDFDEGLLFNLNLTTGNRTILSNFFNPSQGPLGVDPVGVILDGSGNALVTDPESAAGTGGGLLFSVDLTTGNRTLVSDFGNAAQGPLGLQPRGLTLDSSGNALVTGYTAGANPAATLFSVDLTTGNRTVISDFGNATQGPLGSSLQGLAIIPVSDSDGDGVADDEDECPNSDLGESVIIDGCDSGVENTSFENGCSMSDLITELSGEATNHGKFTSSVAKLLNQLKKDGVISGSEKGAIQSCAGGANIP